MPRNLKIFVDQGWEQIGQFIIAELFYLILQKEEKIIIICESTDIKTAGPFDLISFKKRDEEVVSLGQIRLTQEDVVYAMRAHYEEGHE